MNDIGFTVFNSLINVLEAFLLIGFATMYLGIKKEKRHKKRIFLIVWLLFFMEIQIVNSISSFEGMLVFLNPVIIFVYSVCFLNGKKLEKIFVSVLPLLCIGLINSFAGGLAVLLCGQEVDTLISSKSNTYIIVVIFTKISLSIVLWIVLRLRKEIGQLSENKLWILFLIIFITSVISVYLIYITIIDGCTSVKFLYCLIGAIIGIVIMNIVTFYFLKRISKESEMEREIALLEKNIFYQQENVKAILREQENVVRMRHDMKHVMLAIQSLAKQNNTKGISDYCDKYIGEIGSRSLMICTGIVSLDHMLSYKMNQAQDKGIRIKSRTGVIRKTEVSELHLCMIMGNLMDNAIDALLFENLDNRVLEVVIEPNGGYLSIFVKNTISQSVLDKNPTLQTTKEDKNLHGFGIRNIREIVERYNGMVQFYEEEYMFVSHLEI